MLTHANTLALAVTVFTSVACASAPRQATYGGPGPNQWTNAHDAISGTRTTPGIASSSILSSVELAREPATSNLHTALTRLRPRFLQLRGGSLASPTVAVAVPEFASGVAVYVNGNYLGGLDVLHSIQAHDVAGVRHFGQVEAAHHFGSQARYGALQVTLIGR